MSIINVFKKDHETVKHILQTLKDTTERAVKTRQENFEKLVKEFTIHGDFEEKFFYPLLKDKSATHDLVLEAYEEHHEAKLILEEIKRLAPDDERWIAKLTVVKENIEHHIKEEENSLFPKAKNLIAEPELVQLENEYKLFKQKAKNAD